MMMAPESERRLVSVRKTVMGGEIQSRWRFHFDPRVVHGKRKGPRSAGYLRVQGRTPCQGSTGSGRLGSEDVLDRPCRETESWL